MVKPADRQRGELCPECAKRLRAIAKSTPKPGRSLADLFPDVAAEWHSTLNDPVTGSEVNPGSKTTMVALHMVRTRVDDDS
jgi:hypothetical protein